MSKQIRSQNTLKLAAENYIFLRKVGGCLTTFPLCTSSLRCSEWSLGHCLGIVGSLYGVAKQSLAN